jgi:two-component system chemotaxis response regulator CheB
MQGNAAPVKAGDHSGTVTALHGRDPSSERSFVHRDIVVIGASAGGVEALSGLFRGLPAGFPASFFVVLHLLPSGRTMLPAILARAGQMPASGAQDGDRFVPGHVYVAPPDRHMILEQRCIRTTRGPRENGYRPAVDQLFRSAAREYGPRVIAIVLSGSLHDGTEGLQLVKELGGVAIVQSVDDALYPDMPASAAAHVEVDHVATVSGMPELLRRLVEAPVEISRDVSRPVPTRNAEDHETPE